VTRLSPAAPAGLVLAFAVTAWAAGTKPPEVVRPRVEHHLRQAEQIASHLQHVMSGSCPRFGSPREWTTYLDGEVEQVVLLVAHVEQAWVEAKETGDDDVRRAAKAPRKRLEQARALIDKLQGCAGDNGAAFSPMGVWRRIEREVPQRQLDIALPPTQ